MNLIKPFSLKHTAAIAMVAFGTGVILIMLGTVGLDLYYWLPTTSVWSWCLATMMATTFFGFWWGFVSAISYLINSPREKDSSHD